MSGPRACLFDLDNTLTDRAESLRQYTEKFALDFDRQVQNLNPERVFNIITNIDRGGYKAKESPWISIKEGIADCLLSQLRWSAPCPAQGLLVEHFAQYFPLCSVPMPGLYDVLNDLERTGWSLGVVSNGGSESRRRTLESLGITNCFNVVVCSGAYGVKKPQAELFRYAVRELGVEACDAWFVGDHPVNDIEGARRAGLSAIWLKGFHRWPGDLRSAQYEISSLCDIIRIINK